ncbi:TOMM precursor leader peptide-binding protein [Azohydromonas caseinilytica]|uniref:TOMM leader peptide-binding protein n=1 Tax=Azohydromonas caseinilytica TaxID=2728836 RepID=A0A848FF66_9BURK|nr:TOMM precursor leader peptide-binding protein [Azohydromonas caseinilytica]NML16903.1 TOMM precursor leader peptide-binding protein [Azohydromonas caseinilytica]
MAPPALGPSRDDVPRWHPGLALAVIDEHTVLLHGETRRVVLRGAAVVAVAPLIDGRRSVAEIAQVLAPRLGLGELEVGYVLQRLADGGHLSAGAAAQVPAPLVALTALEPGSWPVALALEAAGLRVAATPNAPVALEVLVCADLLDEHVGRHLARARAAGRSVLLARPGGAQPTIGPLLDASPGPCFDCLLHAVAWNRPAQRFVQQRLGQAFTTPASTEPATAATAAAWLAQAVRQAAGGERTLREALLSFDPHTLATTRHAVRRRPQCPTCGDAHLMAAQGFRAPALQSRLAAERTDGGHRCRSPEETLLALRPLVSPVTGAVQYLHPMPGRHTARRQVYVSGYPVCPQTWPSDNGFDKICAGKGRSPAQAQASALCEAIERASSVWQGDEAVLLATRAALGEEALSFETLQGFSARQYARRECINATTTDRRRQVPLPFDDQARIAWTPAWPLDGGPRRLVPLAYCYAETPPGQGSAFGIYNPNGTAAGNVFEEAVLQGLLELVERDATAIWWYQRLARPALDLERIDDAFVQALRADYQASGWSVQVLDLTHDLGIPVYAAVARHEGSDRHALGFGCHLQGPIALSRALTELNQLLDERPDAPPPWDRALLPRAPFLEPAGSVAGALPVLSDGLDLREDIGQCCARLRRAGLSPLVVDKSRPDLGLAVAQVIVPGLRHFWPRFGPGRLYEVPVAMGWVERAAPEEMLNPAPLFL